VGKEASVRVVCLYDHHPVSSHRDFAGRIDSHVIHPTHDSSDGDKGDPSQHGSVGSDNGDSDFRRLARWECSGRDPGCHVPRSFRLPLELFLYANALRSGLQRYLTLLLSVGGGGSLSAG